MKIFVTLGLYLTIFASSALPLTIDFDSNTTWIRAPDPSDPSKTTSIGSYQTEHSYSAFDWTFTGGPAMRKTVSVVDGFAGALGTYSWKLRDEASVSWTATYSGSADISDVSFAVRRWDAGPSPDFSVSYSTDGGTTFSLAGTINNATVDNSSDWLTFDVFSGVLSKDIVVKVEANGTTERILIDDFTFSSAAVPESGTTVAFLGLAAFGLILFRRFQT